MRYEWVQYLHYTAGGILSPGKDSAVVEKKKKKEKKKKINKLKEH